MLLSPCPRCGEPSEGGLCARCTAYLLRFEPFLVRPGLPGPSVDREARPGGAWLTLDENAPVRFGSPPAPREDDGFAVQFLRHLGLPDGGKAPLTRGDRAVLHRLLRKWARAPPDTEPLQSMVRALYAEAAAFPGMPDSIAQKFQSLARVPPAPPVAEIPPPEAEPLPQPEPEPEGLPTPAPQPTGIEPVPSAPEATEPPPPPPPEPNPEEMRVLSELKAELAAKREEFSHRLAEQHREMDRREGLVQSQLDEMRLRESQIQAKERAVAEAEDRARTRTAEEERRLQARAAEVQRLADEAQAGEAKRSLFFLLFSLEGVGRDTAKALSERFVTEDRLRAAPLDEIAAAPGVPPEQAALVRDAFSGGAEPVRRDLREKAEDMLEEGGAEGALEVFNELVRLSPEDVDAWLNRGEVLSILGRAEEAIGSYERALELRPDHKAGRSELANLLFERGEFGAAAAHLQDLLRAAPEQVDEWLARAATLLSEGKATEATLIFNAVLEGDPQNLIASLALGDLLLAMGDAETADREYTRALRHHPDDPDALLKKGLLLNRQGRWGAAIQMFNRAISVRWDHRDAWAAKGQVLLAQGKAKDALECFDRLLGFDESRHDAWLGKAEAHLALGENGAAAEAAGHALALDRGNKDVQELLERLRESTERPHEGVEVSALPPTGTFDAGVLVEMADTLLEAGDPDGAIRGYNEVLARDLKDARAWFGKGRALHTLERYGEAVRCLTAAVELDPANGEYTRWLSMCEERWRREGA